ncbi:MAG: cytochrome c [Acidobacteriota bacterium]|nr:cytochrome c [Acidobacteriota bacterium]
MRPAQKSVRAIALVALSGLSVAACGSQGISVPQSSPYYKGAVLFRDHCAGCHTISVAGTQGSATNVKDRVRNQGPNFDVRPETVATVLYAIRNGGFSGQIMPQNVVVGSEAQEVAQFLSHYAGTQAPKVPSVEISLPGAGNGAKAGAGATGAAGTAAPAGGNGATGSASATGGTPAAGAAAATKAPAGAGASSRTRAHG